MSCRDRPRHLLEVNPPCLVFPTSKRVLRTGIYLSSLFSSERPPTVNIGGDVLEACCESPIIQSLQQASTMSCRAPTRHLLEVNPPCLLFPTSKGVLWTGIYLSSLFSSERPPTVNVGGDKLETGCESPIIQSLQQASTTSCRAPTRHLLEVNPPCLLFPTSKGVLWTAIFI